jgi:hypothetical protein
MGVVRKNFVGGLESWNFGIMGLTDLLLPPAFHYSTIPVFHERYPFGAKQSQFLWGWILLFTEIFCREMTWH